MARPRTFEPDEVLGLAQEVFWRQGYQGTSFDDITAKTGLTKPSLYAAFGDKESLFLKVLDRYHGILLERAAEIFNGDLSAREAVAAWFTSLLPHCSGAKGERGCLSVNTLTGGFDETALKKNITRFNTALQKLIFKRLEADRAQFSRDFDPASTARTIMTLYMGLMAMARLGPSTPEVKSVIAQAQKLLA